MSVKLLADEEDAKKMFREAMSKGFITSKDLVIVLVGIAGSGKSSFKRVCLNLPPEEIRVSTSLVEDALRNMSISRKVSISRATVSAHDSDSIEWKKVNSDELLGMVADAIKRRGLSQEPTDVSLKSAASPSSSNAPTMTGIKEDEMKSRDQRASPQNEPSSSDRILPSGGELRELELDDPLLPLIAKSKGQGNLLEVHWIYIIDTGGQPQFLQLLPAFIESISACVCLLRLDQKLDDNPLVQYFDTSGKQIGEAYPSEQTNLQIIESCVRTIHSKCTLKSNEPPRFFVVGSHFDKYEKEKCAETIEKKNERLLKMLSNMPSVMYYGSDDNEELIFPLNCKVPKEPDHGVAAEFRKCVMSCCSISEDPIPLAWFVLEERIRQYATEKGFAYVERATCAEIASKLHMSPEVFDAALNHLLKLNIFRCYPGVPNLIFCTTQVVLQMLTELVQYSFQLRRGGIRGISSEAIDFKNEGKFSTEFLKERLSSFFSDLFTPDIFLGILRRLLAVAYSDVQDGKHFMPSLLNKLTDKEKAKCRSSSESLSALLIRLHGGCLPNGLFTSLVVSLVNSCGWELYKLRGKPDCLYQNCVTFAVPGHLAGGTVTLIESFSYLEVHVSCLHESKIDSVCTRAFGDIKSGLKTSWKVLYPDAGEVGFSPTFFCDSCNPTSAEHARERHRANISDEEDYETCSEDPKFGAPLCPSKLRWLKITSKSDLYILHNVHVAIVLNSMMSHACIHDI